MIFDGQANFYDRFNAYFTDYSLVPLLVQQNFLDVINKYVLSPGPTSFP